MTHKVKHVKCGSNEYILVVGEFDSLSKDGGGRFKTCTSVYKSTQIIHNLIIFKSRPLLQSIIDKMNEGKSLLLCLQISALNKRVKVCGLTTVSTIQE